MGKNAPTLPETAAFLEAAQAAGPRDHALACLLTLNGLTVEAVCGARASDLRGQEGRGELAVSLVGGRPVAMPIPPRTLSALEDHLAGRDEGPLLLADDGSPLGIQDAHGIVRRLVRAAGLGHRLD
jgi:integrase/recombinase XerD